MRGILGDEHAERRQHGDPGNFSTPSQKVEKQILLQIGRPKAGVYGSPVLHFLEITSVTP
jgi:hypothetical protein